ncbi:flagellar export chaperone FliS [Clostridium sp. D53t1_180928_C8]|uniref:flagellar export chaperone FliS n=1 Tax=Clostridium sp. D53t1_180928_C8 TaxID=2787101 RepID=UPI0018A9A171|nr:flagellar export chaperone FliS [Clostridium sp. D53t1_180928_C8]
MYNGNPYNAYKQNMVNTASNEKLLLMLVDGAVKYTKIARLAIENKDIQRAHKELTRVQDIFTELMVTIDKNAGQVYENMYNIYDFIKSRLVQANLKKDIKIIDEILPLIENVRDTWHEISKKAKGL